MTFQNPFGQPLLTFPELDKSPLSIRAKRWCSSTRARSSCARTLSAWRHNLCRC